MNRLLESLSGNINIECLSASLDIEMDKIPIQILSVEGLLLNECNVSEAKILTCKVRDIAAQVRLPDGQVRVPKIEITYGPNITESQKEKNIKEEQEALKYDFVDLTPEHLSSVAFFQDQQLPEKIMFTFKTTAGKKYKKVYKAKNSRWSIQDFFDAVAKFELAHARKNSEWFGGIDTHHIFYEGIFFCGYNNKSVPMFVIHWGS
tara:strand:+ start:111 stop:725 length:615 start_codon:yes stop_codon:yes gene_type:complete